MRAMWVNFVIIRYEWTVIGATQPEMIFARKNPSSIAAIFGRPKSLLGEDFYTRSLKRDYSRFWSLPSANISYVPAVTSP